MVISGMPDSTECKLGATMEIVRFEGFWKEISLSEKKKS